MYSSKTKTQLLALGLVSMLWGNGCAAPVDGYQEASIAHDAEKIDPGTATLLFLGGMAVSGLAMWGFRTLSARFARENHERGHAEVDALAQDENAEVINAQPVSAKELAAAMFEVINTAAGMNMDRAIETVRTYTARVRRDAERRRLSEQYGSSVDRSCKVVTAGLVREDLIREASTMPTAIDPNAESAEEAIAPRGYVRLSLLPALEGREVPTAVGASLMPESIVKFGAFDANDARILAVKFANLLAAAAYPYAQLVFAEDVSTGQSILRTAKAAIRGAVEVFQPGTEGYERFCGAGKAFVALAYPGVSGSGEALSVQCPYDDPTMQGCGQYL